MESGSNVFYNTFFLKIVQFILLGNSNHNNTYNFESFFISKFKLSKRKVDMIQLTFILLSLIFIGFQTIIAKRISLEGSFFIIIVLFLCFRIFNHIIFLQYKNCCTNIETIGYFVVNELLVILETSQSLKEAVKFIISSNYPVYSDIFRDAMLSTHFGISLEESIKDRLGRNLQGEIYYIFLNILENWEIGKNLALISKNRILNKISEKIIEETYKIDSLSSLTSGIMYLSPPVILCFLLISGNMNEVYGMLIAIGILIGSYFMNPENNLTLFSGNNQLLLSYNNESMEFLIILSENLCRGFSFHKSVNKSLSATRNDDKQQIILEKSKLFATFKLGITQESENDYLLELFSERIVRLLLLVKKFSLISSSVAGEKLLQITKEISKTNQILTKGRGQLKAAQFQQNIIQLLALISLAFIAGASPFFLFVSNMVSNSFSDSITIIRNPLIDLSFFLVAFVICISPIRNVGYKVKDLHNKDLREILFKISKFILFLITYFITSRLIRNLY